MRCDSLLNECTELEERLEQQIQRRTFGRVRHVRVEATSEHIVVHGSTTSYYVVQLVVHAVREVLPTTPVVLDIQVVPGDRAQVVQGIDRPLIHV
jgi:hypothetical protein